MIMSFSITRRVFILALVFYFFLLVYQADAEITSFQVNPPSINNNQLVSFIWSAQNSSGVKLFLPCIRGIRYTKDTGSSVTCGIDITGLPANGAYTVTINNINSNTVAVQAKLVNKSSAGSYQEDNPSYAKVDVAPAQFVISSFTSSSQDIEGGQQVTFTWSALYVSKVNFYFSCTDGVRVVHESSPSSLPCSTPVLSTPLGASGTTKFTFYLDQDSIRNVGVTVLPRHEDGTYEAYLGKTLTINIKPPAPKVPRVTIISPSSVMVASGSSTIISWAGENIAGVNLVIPCLVGISASSTQPQNIALPCGIYAYTSPLSASSSAILYFYNKTSSRQLVMLMLFPALSTNTYDGVLAKEIRIEVLPVGATPAVIPPVSSFVQPTPLSRNSALRYTFSRTLSYGMRSDLDVRALQEILLAEKVYSGPVTGNFYGLTRQGVRDFQKKYKIDPVGIVGPKTRAKLNELYSK